MVNGDFASVISCVQYKVVSPDESWNTLFAAVKKKWFFCCLFYHVHLVD